MKKMLNEKNVNPKALITNLCYKLNQEIAPGYITSEWIEKEVNTSILEILFEGAFKNFDDDSMLNRVEFVDDVNMTGELQQTDYLNSHLINYHVISNKNDNLAISTIWEFETEIEIGFKEIIEKESSYEYRYEVEHRTGELDMDMVFTTEAIVGEEYFYRYFNPLYIVEFEIKLMEGKIKSYNLTKIY